MIANDVIRSWVWTPRYVILSWSDAGWPCHLATDLATNGTLRPVYRQWRVKWLWIDIDCVQLKVKCLNSKTVVAALLPVFEWVPGNYLFVCLFFSRQVVVAWRHLFSTRKFILALHLIGRYVALFRIGSESRPRNDLFTIRFIILKYVASLWKSLQWAAPKLHSMAPETSRNCSEIAR